MATVLDLRNKMDDLESIKENIRQTIIMKGVSVPAEATVSSYGDYIRMINPDVQLKTLWTYGKTVSGNNYWEVTDLAVPTKVQPYFGNNNQYEIRLDTAAFFKNTNHSLLRTYPNDSGRAFVMHSAFLEDDYSQFGGGIAVLYPTDHTTDKLGNIITVPGSHTQQEGYNSGDAITMISATGNYYLNISISSYDNTGYNDVIYVTCNSLNYSTGQVASRSIIPPEPYNDTFVSIDFRMGEFDLSGPSVRPQEKSFTRGGVSQRFERLIVREKVNNTYQTIHEYVPYARYNPATLTYDIFLLKDLYDQTYEQIIPCPYLTFNGVTHQVHHNELDGQGNVLFKFGYDLY